MKLVVLCTMLQIAVGFRPVVIPTGSRGLTRPWQITTSRGYSAVMRSISPEGRSPQTNLQLLETLEQAPRTPGVYIMKNAQSNILYIGKVS